MRIFILGFLFIITCCQCKSSQYSTNKDGKCYEEYTMADQYQITIDSYTVFTGNISEEDVDLEVKLIVLQEASSEWVKKKADKNCLSANPEDCLVWCLVEVPAAYDTLTILKDTTQSSNFKYHKIERTDLIRESYSELRPVICRKDLTRELIDAIQDSLISEGYFLGTKSNFYDIKTRSAVGGFQNDKKLARGHLDLATLDALGIVLDNYKAKPEE